MLILIDYYKLVKKEHSATLRIMPRKEWGLHDANELEGKIDVQFTPGKFHQWFLYCRNKTEY
jgi:hypothetical protein